MGRKKELTAKMQAALVHFAQHRNKTHAYKHAYDCENMQPQTIVRKSQELFEHPMMVEAVEKMKTAAAEQVEVNALWVLKRAALLANFNINKFIKVNDDGTAMYDFSTATDDDWYCISEITIDTITKGSGGDKYDVDRVKLKAESKVQALKIVGDHVNVQAFSKNVNLTAAIGLTELSKEEYKEARREMLKDDDC